MFVLLPFNLCVRREGKNKEAQGMKAETKIDGVCVCFVAAVQFNLCVGKQEKEKDTR